MQQGFFSTPYNDNLSSQKVLAFTTSLAGCLIIMKWKHEAQLYEAEEKEILLKMFQEALSVAHDTLCLRRVVLDRRVGELDCSLNIQNYKNKL